MVCGKMEHVLVQEARMLLGKVVRQLVFQHRLKVVTNPVAMPMADCLFGVQEHVILPAQVELVRMALEDVLADNAQNNPLWLW